MNVRFSHFACANSILSNGSLCFGASTGLSSVLIQNACSGFTGKQTNPVISHNFTNASSDTGILFGLILCLMATSHTEAAL